MRAVIALFLLLLATPAHALIVCNGDSNTESDYWAEYFPNGMADGWCERLAGAVEQATVNRGVGRSGISDNGLYNGSIPLWGGYYIDQEVAGIDPFIALANGTPTFLGQPLYSPLGVPDIFIFALGANDLIYGYTPKQVIHYLKKYRQRAIAAGATVYVATLPPRYVPGTCTLAEGYDKIVALNQLIRGNWPAKYIEFHDWFDCSDFLPDGAHINADGHAKRAAMAAWALLQ